MQNISILEFMELIKDDGGGSDSWSYIHDVQSSVKSVTTNNATRSRLPFLSSNQQCQNTEGNTNYLYSNYRRAPSRAHTHLPMAQQSIPSQCSTLVRNTVVRAIVQAYGKW